MNNLREKMASHIYENLPLKKLNKNLSELSRSNKFAFPDEQKRKVTSPEIQDSLETLLETKSVAKAGKKSENPKDFGSTETIKANNEEKSCSNQNGQNKKIQSTPLSTLDDGYGSSNSTPQVSGK
ncbi:unnamed protein product [Diabrotica balteata]|uniref:Uncharacterized protein n=1 Tax=Diabrotica balteata TaxID=107213 RepID=A0A9N9XD08_DIABA|nr:unnamed protein product [Diabrotica balteata]